MGQDTGTVVPFTKEMGGEQILNSMSERVLKEVFNGKQADFDAAFADASTEQMLDLIQAAAETTKDVVLPEFEEEFYDAMIGVMKQWLGEHKAEDEDFVREAYAPLL